MSRFISCFLLVLGISLTVFGQKKEEPPNCILIVEDNPEFIGGQRKMMQFIYSNLIYPEKALQEEIKGLVVVSFVVMKTGKIDSISIKRDIGYGCGDEAVRLVNLMQGKWKAGKKRGEPIDVRFNLPIRFEYRNYERKLTGTKQEIDDFIYSILQFPEEAKKRGVEGTVALELQLNQYGTITWINIKKDVDDLFGDEAVRLILLAKDFWKAYSKNIDINRPFNYYIDFKFPQNDKNE